jgi:hypothetical protein
VKGRTGAILTLGIIAIFAVAFLLISDTVFDLGFGIIRDTTVSSSVATLTQVRNVLSLNTLEVVRKVVFPYDFVPAEMDWNLFLKIREKRALSLLEMTYLETYELCMDIGIDLRKKRREFVVVTAIIKAGFDLSNPVFTTPEQAGSALADNYIRSESDGGVTIMMPPAVITDLIIEDADTDSYPYPDMQIGPENWKKLTSFVKGRIENETTADNILALATENGRQFLRRVFLDTGYSEVRFSR